MALRKRGSGWILSQNSFLKRQSHSKSGVNPNQLQCHGDKVSKSHRRIGRKLHTFDTAGLNFATEMMASKKGKQAVRNVASGVLAQGWGTASQRVCLAGGVASTGEEDLGRGLCHVPGSTMYYYAFWAST